MRPPWPRERGVRRLLRADADAGMRDWQADTALKLAQRQGHTACVESLKEHVAAEMGDASSGEAATHASNAGGELSGYAMHERILQKYVRDWQAGLSEEKRAGWRRGWRCRQTALWLIPLPG